MGFILILCLQGLLMLAIYTAFKKWQARRKAHNLARDFVTIVKIIQKNDTFLHEYLKIDNNLLIMDLLHYHGIYNFD